MTVDTNVRKDARLTSAFVSSIRELGVLEPVIALRKADGAVHVLMGQRSTLAAVEAKLPNITVVVIDSPDEADRIITQVVENIQRAELGHADQAVAFQQLSLMHHWQSVTGCLNNKQQPRRSGPFNDLFPTNRRSGRLRRTGLRLQLPWQAQRE